MEVRAESQLSRPAPRPTDVGGLFQLLRDGLPTNPPIMPGWDDADVPGMLRHLLGAPVLVDNDVNIMALGEHWAEFPDVDHLLFVKVATGIGAGVISDGQIRRGAQGAAGDLGAPPDLAV